MWKTDSEKRMFEEKLQKQLDAGEITIEESEFEWQDVFNPEPKYCGQEW